MTGTDDKTDVISNVPVIFTLQPGSRLWNKYQETLGAKLSGTFHNSLNITVILSQYLASNDFIGINIPLESQLLKLQVWLGRIMNLCIISSSFLRAPPLPAPSLVTNQRED